jgi:hypothetical protein
MKTAPFKSLLASASRRIQLIIQLQPGADNPWPLAIIVLFYLKRGRRKRLPFKSNGFGGYVMTVPSQL